MEDESFYFASSGRCIKVVQEILSVGDKIIYIYCTVYIKGLGLKYAIPHTFTKKNEF